MKTWLIFSCSTLIYIVFGLSPCSPPQQTTELPSVVSQHPAAPNYALYCAGCHGRNLEKFEEKDWMSGNNQDAIIKSIKYGMADAGMPAFEQTFTDEEIKSLADFVQKGIPTDKSQLKKADAKDPIVSSEEFKFVVDTVVSGLKIPWGLAFLPGGDMLISERSGTLHRYSNGKLSEPIEGLPEIVAKGQGGLLDLCLHPKYTENGWIYISYSAAAPDGSGDTNTAIMRAKLKGNQLTEQQVIFQALPFLGTGHHFGNKMVFDREGYLHFGVGDRGKHFEYPQKLDNHNGKMHRIKDDGTIPEDNPFVNTAGAMPSIYSYGVRNPQGTAMHPETGEIWESEHGPKGGDELNLIKPGVNYGWPVISYGINYNGTILTELTEKQGMEQPLFYWKPSIAPCGMTFVTGNRYPKWKNNILLGSLSFEYLERVVMNGYKVTHREKLLEDIGRVRNVVMGPDGYIYVAIENPGKILRIMPLD